MPHKAITTININCGNIIGSGIHLPFKKGSFDAVVTADTLEHISRRNRRRFIDELLRVAIKRVVVCAPLGTEKHIEYENYLYHKQISDDFSKGYLYEHIRYGLPTPEEIQRLSKMYRGRIYYQGDFRKIKNDKIHRMIAIINNIYKDHIGAEYFLGYGYNDYTNRFFLCIDKKIC